jgi:hypothetical protein
MAVEDLTPWARHLPGVTGSRRRKLQTHGENIKELEEHEDLEEDHKKDKSFRVLLRGLRDLRALRDSRRVCGRRRPMRCSFRLQAEDQK